MDMRGVKPKDIQEYLGFGCVQSVYRWLDGVSMPTVDNANNIYTRVMDSNTPKNKTAEILHIEYLWKKRFRLLMAPLEQAFYFLLKREEWEDVPDDSSVTRMYYKYSPEYVIEYDGCDDRDGYVYYLFSQTDSRPHWYNIYMLNIIRQYCFQLLV